MSGSTTLAPRAPASARAWLRTLRVVAVLAFAFGVAGIIRGTNNDQSGLQIASTIVALVALLVVALLGRQALRPAAAAAAAAPRAERAPAVMETAHGPVVAPRPVGTVWLRTVQVVGVLALAVAIAGVVRGATQHGGALQIVALVVALGAAGAGTLTGEHALSAPAARTRRPAAAVTPAGPRGQHESWLLSVRFLAFASLVLSVVALTRAAHTGKVVVQAIAFGLSLWAVVAGALFQQSAAEGDDAHGSVAS